MNKIGIIKYVNEIFEQNEHIKELHIINTKDENEKYVKIKTKQCEELNCYYCTTIKEFNTDMTESFLQSTKHIGDIQLFIILNQNKVGIVIDAY